MARRFRRQDATDFDVPYGPSPVPEPVGPDEGSPRDDRDEEAVPAP
jgi:hypothetical protein